MPRVDQIVDGFAVGDAVSAEARRLRSHLRALGFDSEILAVPGRIAPDAVRDALPLDALSGRQPDAVILHHSIESPAADAWRAGGFRRLLLYHNITPAEWFRGFDDAVAARLDRARRRLPEIVAAAHAVAAVSEFNAADLRAAGAREVAVIPLASAADPLPPPDPAVVRRRRSGGFVNVLHVGRLAPNKCIEELIESFAWYHAGRNPRSRLVLAGSEAACPRYAAMLRLFTAEIDVFNAEFAGFLDEPGLAAWFAAADVVVSVSRHEGFCRPLVTAMLYDVPVIARSVGGVPEALGRAGILFDDAEPRELAALIDLAVSDPALRASVVSAQRARLAALRARDIPADLARWLTRAGLPIGAAQLAEGSTGGAAI